MNFSIEIDEKRITELVEKEIAKKIVNEYGYVNQESQFGIRKGIEKAVKEYIYSVKDEVIEKTIERASREITKKGLPKLLEGMK